MIQPVSMFPTQTGVMKGVPLCNSKSIDFKKSGKRIAGVGVLSTTFGGLAMKMAKDYTGSNVQAGALGLCMAVAAIFMLSPVFFVKNK